MASNRENTAKFGRELEKFSKKLGLRFDLVVTKITVDLFTRIVERTPIDTGRARASWNIGVGSVDLSVAPEGDNLAKAAANISKNASELFGADLTKVERLYISNNLPYIEALENGHSKQAPQGMVFISVLETKAFINSVLKKK